LNRYEQVRDNIPSLLTPSSHEGETCLYIGGNLLRCEMARELRIAGFEITLLEVFKPYCDALEKEKKFFGVFSEIINENIQYFKSERTWDIVAWWHGPEHITIDSLPDTIFSIEKVTKKLVVFACPFGRYDFDESQAADLAKRHGKILGTEVTNVFEIHSSALYPDFFTKLGYKVNTIGGKDIPGSNLLAWKYV